MAEPFQFERAQETFQRGRAPEVDADRMVRQAEPPPAQRRRMDAARAFLSKDAYLERA